MSWKESLAKEISENVFLKMTSDYQELKKYVMNEIKRIQLELLELSDGAGTFIEKDEGEGVFYYTLQDKLNNKIKGFKVRYNDTNSEIRFLKIADKNQYQHGVKLLVLISPSPEGAFVTYVDNDGYNEGRNLITKESIDHLIANAFNY